jgi:hypothetical protein
MFEPNNEVAVDTEDLDAFSDMFHGVQKHELETEDKPVDVVEDEPTDDPVDVEQPEDSDTPDKVDEPEDDDPEEKPEPKKSGLQKRIDKLLERERLANEKAAALEARLAEVEAKTKTPDTPAKAGPNPDDTNDDGTDKYPLGEFDPNYVRDLADFTIEQRLAEREAKEAKERETRQAEEARAALHTQWTEKLAPVAETHEDFMDKVAELEDTFEGLDPTYSDYLAQTIKSLDHGPEVLYYFANNLDEAEKFVRMGPLKATLVLGEINAMFKGQTRKEPKVSKAPPPPQLNKGSNTRTTHRADTDDLDAFSQMFFKKKG